MMDEKEATPLVDKANNKPSIFGSTFNLLNVVFGSGILGIPYAFGQAGVLVAMLLTILIGLATLLSFYLLLWSTEATQVFTSYPELSLRAFGRVGRALMWVVFILDILGSLAASLTVIKDSVFQFLTKGLASPIEDSSPYLATPVLSAFILLILVPFTMFTKINWLGFTSFMSLLPVLYLIAIEAWLLSVNGTTTPPPMTAPSFFLSFPVILFSFSCQNSYLTIYHDLRQRGGGYDDMVKVGFATVFLSFMLYASCGVLGVVLFPMNVEGNVMLNFPAGPAVDVLLVSMAVAVLFGCPVLVFVLRDLLEEGLRQTLGWQFFYPRFVAEGVLIAGAGYSLTVLFPSFISIVGIFGSFTKVAICLVLPALLYLKIVASVTGPRDSHDSFVFDDNNNNNKECETIPLNNETTTSSLSIFIRKALAWALLVGGGASGIVSIVVNIMAYVGKSKSQVLD